MVKGRRTKGGGLFGPDAPAAEQEPAKSSWFGKSEPAKPASSWFSWFGAKKTDQAAAPAQAPIQAAAPVAGGSRKHKKSNKNRKGGKNKTASNKKK
jgi:hypothetical protein